MGATLALLAVIGLLSVYELTDLKIDKDMVLALFAAAATVAAAGFAAWGIGWQIQEGREAQKRVRLAALHANKIELQGALSEIIGALIALLDIFCDLQKTPTQTDIEKHFRQIRNCRSIIAETSRYAEVDDAKCLAVFGGELQRFELQETTIPGNRNMTDHIDLAVAIYRFCTCLNKYARTIDSPINIDMSKQFQLPNTVNPLITINALTSNNIYHLSLGKSPHKSYEDIITRIKNATTPTERPPS